MPFYLSFSFLIAGSTAFGASFVLLLVLIDYILHALLKNGEIFISGYIQIPNVLNIPRVLTRLL